MKRAGNSNGDWCRRRKGSSLVLIDSKSKSILLNKNEHS